MVEFAPAGLFLSDPSGVGLYANRRWSQLCGLTLADPDDRHWARRIHPDDQARMTAEWAECERTGREFSLEARLVHADGRVTRNCVSAVALRDVAGALTGYLGSIVDVTARWQAEAKTREEWELFATVVDATRQLVMVLDPAGRIQRFSAACERATGYAAADVVGRAVWEYLDDGERRRAQRAMGSPAHAAASGGGFVGRWRAKDGGVRLIEWSTTPRLDALGQMTMVICVGTDLTDRARAEDAVHRDMPYLLRQLEQLPAIIWTTDLDLRLTTQSGAGLAALGLVPGQLVGVPLDRLFTESTAHTKSLFLRALDGERAVTVETWGGRRLHLSIGPLTDADGRIVGTIGMSLDLTEQYRAERALKESQDLLQSLIQSSPVAVGFRDLDLRTVFVNDALAKINGLPSDAHLGRRPSETLPDLGPRLEKSLREVIRTGQAQVNQELLGETNAHPGERRAYLVSHFPIRSADGAITGVGTMVSDITDRQRAEAALRRNEERLRLAMEGARLGYWEWEVATNVVAWSENLEAQFGYAPGTFPGTFAAYLDLIHPGDRPGVEVALAEGLRGGAKVDIESRIIRPTDGAILWFQCRGRVYLDGAGAPLRAIGIALDVTERRCLENERTRLLAMERATRLEAERLNRVKDEFLTTLSHELRTPLNAILGWSQLLGAGTLDATAALRAAKTIERNAKYEAMLVDDLLDIATIVSGKLKLSPAPLALGTAVIAAIETLRLAADAKQIALTYAGADGADAVVGDAKRLQQVVWNLLSNAVKFTPRGGRIDLRVERQDSALRLAVADSGIGIKAEFLPHVFERFQQADSSTTRTFGGLGLGLAIVRQIVEAHGGVISVTSPGQGCGAVFTVELPADTAAAARSRAAPPDARAPARAELSLSGLRLLVVDDEPDSLEIVSAMLEQCGATVKAVGDTAAALEALAEWCPDVLISDIGMPDADGYELIRRVRALPSAGGGRIKAVALTAYAGDAERQRALAAGFQAHLAKPLERRALAEAMTALGRGDPSS